MTSVGLSTFRMTLAIVNVLPGPGHAEQRLVLRAGQQTFRQLRNGLRLVAGGLVWRNEFEHRTMKLRVLPA